jgi:hypothetical protein
VKVTARQMRKFGLRSVSLKFRFLPSRFHSQGKEIALRSLQVALNH